MFKRSLYPHARLFYPLIHALAPNHFAADLDLVRGLEGLKRMRDFNTEIAEHRYHPANLGSARSFFKLRVSVSRLRQIARSTLHSEES